MSERVNKVGQKVRVRHSILVPQTTSKDSWIRNASSGRERRDTPGLYSANASFNQGLFGNSDSVSLEDLAILADRALASENDVKESQPAVKVLNSLAI